LPEFSPAAVLGAAMSVWEDDEADLPEPEQLASPVLVSGGDVTTAWSAHLAALPVPKNEEERKALLAGGGSAGGLDLTTLVAQGLGYAAGVP
jgi:hypothetical protein